MSNGITREYRVFCNFENLSLESATPDKAQEELSVFLVERSQIYAEASSIGINLTNLASYRGGSLAESRDAQLAEIMLKYNKKDLATAKTSTGLGSAVAVLRLSISQAHMSKKSSYCMLSTVILDVEEER